ncbi:hypothetical protein E6W39_31585 [Kitasatospora acidiphila]|uniref:Uncharacterized protein n=1 Tax=Kitasatospora acidiphila TaxID=2567942 RepID=A0A540WA88_9ACTN|nr:DUF6004 family protein [Kitasatospora acidiphila]TQF05940.1 hypothetical protein E6W39_31585 [Kitasatospora acidiphila]
MSGGNETYESLDVRPKPDRPHVLAAATVVFGEDLSSGRRETIPLSGFTQLNHWPMPGFEHRVDDKGHAEFDLELISAPEVGIKGYSYELNDRIQVLTNPFLTNTGRIRQASPGKNFPAELSLRRFGILETSTLRLAHRNAIDMSGTFSGLPPFLQPSSVPYLGSPAGDGPLDVQAAPGVLRATTLPEAWYPADDENQPTGDTPKLFFAASASPFMAIMVDPSLIMQTTLEGTLELEVGGKTVRVDLAGDHNLAAGAEILLFGPDKHDEGAGVKAQLARLAVTGQCAELGGRVMLRVSWSRPSGGTLGSGSEDSLTRVAFPSELHLDTNFELCTPSGTLYADTSMRLAGKLSGLEPTGTELRTEGAATPLKTPSGEVKARLTEVRLTMRDAYVGEYAPVSM